MYKSRSMEGQGGTKKSVRLVKYETIVLRGPTQTAVRATSEHETIGQAAQKNGRIALRPYTPVESWLSTLYRRNVMRLD